jgi:hypothetical protein
MGPGVALLKSGHNLWLDALAKETTAADARFRRRTYFVRNGAGWAELRPTTLPDDVGVHSRPATEGVVSMAVFVDDEGCHWAQEEWHPET